RGVEDDLESVVRRLTRAVVVRVDREGDALVVLPGTFTVEHVRAVADRVLAERVHVLECRGGKRVVGRVTEAQREVREGLVQRDRELGVADLLETREL